MDWISYLGFGFEEAGGCDGVADGVAAGAAGVGGAFGAGFSSLWLTSSTSKISSALGGMVKRGVELGAVDEIAGVVDGVPLVRCGELACADLGIDVVEGEAGCFQA